MVQHNGRGLPILRGALSVGSGGAWLVPAARAAYDAGTGGPLGTPVVLHLMHALGGSA